MRDLENQRADFKAWLPKAYRQPQESYSVHNMEVAFVAGYKAGRAALESPEVRALRDALEMIAGIRPCPDSLMGNSDIARAALAAMEQQK